MKDFQKWLEDRVTFYLGRFDTCIDTPGKEEEANFYYGKSAGMTEALTYLKENIISDPRIHETLLGEDYHLLKCVTCEVPEEEECKLCSSPDSRCSHSWVKMAPLNPDAQKYLCENCDKVK
jgi:hypothetical protein